MTAQDIRSQIDTLRRTAETGAQWAEICRLEALTIAADEPCPLCHGEERVPPHPNGDDFYHKCPLCPA